MINSRELGDLVPSVEAKAIAFKDACAKHGIDIIFTSTYRDNESQDALYAVGRTVKGANPRLLKPMGDTVTNAKGGWSWHNWRCAFDFAPVVNGKVPWNDSTLFARCGEIAESVGLQWAGRWTGSLKEMAHCQDSHGLSLADLNSGKKL